MKYKIIICDNCGIFFKKASYFIKIHKNNFCSTKCHYNHSSKYLVGKNNQNYKGKIVVRCNNCNKELKIFPFQLKRNHRHFCKNEHKCYGEWRSKYQIGKNNPCYINGESRFPYSLEFNNQLKEFIRKRDGYKCMECGAPQKELIHTLEPHHIDYNKFNNTTINLISLCKSCNLKANFNRRYWQNHYEQIQIDRKVHLLDMKLEMKLEMEEKIE